MLDSKRDAACPRQQCASHTTLLLPINDRGAEEGREEITVTLTLICRVSSI